MSSKPELITIANSKDNLKDNNKDNNKDNSKNNSSSLNNKEENNYILNNVVWFNPKQSTKIEKITPVEKKKINFDDLEKMISDIITNKNT